MVGKKNPQGRKPGATIKPVDDRQKFVAQRKTNGLTGGRWEVRNGKKVWVPGK